MTLAQVVANYTKAEFQSFYTESTEIRLLMLQLLGNVQNLSLLEPCAGEGAFLTDLIGIPASIDAIDIDERHVQFLGKHFPAWVKPIHADFIDYFVSGQLFHPIEIKRSYDAVICNPPYGLSFALDYRKRIKKQYPDYYVRESYSLFMLFALACLRTGGRYVFIVPDTFLTSHNHTPLRKFLAKEAYPTHLIQFASNRFESVNFGYGNLCIIAGIKQPLEAQHNVQWVDATTYKGHLSLDLFTKSKPTTGSYLLQHFIEGWIHPLRKAATELAVPTVKLGEIAECRTGIYSGDNKRFYGYDSIGLSKRSLNGHPINWNTQVRLDELSNEEKLLGIAGVQHYVPLVRGGHHEPLANTAWAVDWSREAVSFYARDKKARLQNAAFYFRKGLAVPMVTSGRLSASLLENAIFDQGVVGVFPEKEELLDFLLVYLNSDFVANTVKSIINPGANNSANYIKKIPVPTLNLQELEEAQSIVSLAKTIGWEATKSVRANFLKRIILF
jgi:hypothetical protein